MSRDHTPQGSEPPRIRPWNRWKYPPDPQYVEVIAERIYAYDLDRRTALSRYFALLVFAVLIATFGLHKDSATIIVSAMLLEQVMLPIVAFSLALVTGAARRQLGAGVLILLSAVTAIALSWLVTELMLSDRSRLSGQIAANSAPNLTDLIVALVAGTACGYVLIHHQALGALPGVAVGLSLVPPLCATGYLLAQGERSMANGALLMFGTNLAAIIFAAAVVFILSGFLPVQSLGSLPRKTKIGLACAAIAVVLVAVPLQHVTSSIIQDARDDTAALDATTDWASRTLFRVENVEVDGDEVDVELSGPTPVYGAQMLATNISSALDRPISLHVIVFLTSEAVIDGHPN